MVDNDIKSHLFRFDLIIILFNLSLMSVSLLLFLGHNAFPRSAFPFEISVIQSRAYCVGAKVRKLSVHTIEEKINGNWSLLWCSGKWDVLSHFGLFSPTCLSDGEAPTIHVLQPAAMLH